MSVEHAQQPVANEAARGELPAPESAHVAPAANENEQARAEEAT